MSSLNDETLKARMLKYAQENPLKIKNLKIYIDFFCSDIKKVIDSEEYIKHKTILDNILNELKKILGNEAIDSFKSCYHYF